MSDITMPHLSWQVILKVIYCLRLATWGTPKMSVINVVAIDPEVKIFLGKPKKKRIKTIAKNPY